MAKRLQEQEGRPMSIEDRDRLIAIETQDCELAKLLQEKVRFINFYMREVCLLRYNIFFRKKRD